MFVLSQKKFALSCARLLPSENTTLPAVSDVPESSHGAVLRSRNLLDAIEGKAELICSLVDGATTTELLHALWLSERMQVKVPVFPANTTG